MEIFSKVFTIYIYMDDYLGSVTWIIHTNFCSPFKGDFIKNLALFGQADSEKMWMTNR